MKFEIMPHKEEINKPVKFAESDLDDDATCEEFDYEKEKKLSNKFWKGLNKQIRK